jgi:hypothetical protein
MKARLHIYPHSEPGGTAYIVGEKAALKNLGEILIASSKSIVGFDKTRLHTSDGHEYTIVAVSDISEDEWQSTPPPYSQLSLPNFESVDNYQALALEINRRTN